MGEESVVGEVWGRGEKVVEEGEDIGALDGGGVRE